MSDKIVIRTEKAPAPFQGDPYSQAIRAGGLVFVSGQLALKPGDKQIEATSIQEQTEQVFANLRAILEEAGSGLDRLVKTTVFLVSLDDFQGMNEVYARHVGENDPPTRSIGPRHGPKCANESSVGAPETQYLSSFCIGFNFGRHADVAVRILFGLEHAPILA